MSRPGDWNCRSCQHLNFQRRDSCQRCGDSKYGDRVDFGAFGGRGGSSFGFSGSDVRPGDWYCAVVTSPAPEDLVVVLAALDGSLVTGYAAGQDVMSTTLLAEWNASNAVPQETHTRNDIIQFWGCSQAKEAVLLDISLDFFIDFLGC
ncbi:hypothetical protein L6164_021594 [Bauhinia variegata]|uniref:Uncharacterized protein n=1 Tax=Bauhinia variegata TaxID=167791 RepID=A0ACB9N0G0_BAUVA|nr:hypothetical protein L6164_021594 [Bauhinia variegata]